MPTYQVRALPDFAFANPLENAEANRSLELNAYSPKGAYTVVKEYLVYDLGDLAGDVGGMGGMLLGVTVLTVYDSATKFVRIAFKKIRQRKEQVAVLKA